jgi:hypothetical protein
MTGFWLYCLTDAILTPARHCRGLSKRAWITVIAVTFIGGALAWLIVRRPMRSHAWTAADDAAARHPAGRARVADGQVAPSEPGRSRGSRKPKGPDDDLEFLRALDQAIRRNPPVG